MDFSPEQKNYIIQRIKFSYSKGFYEGMVSGLTLGIVLGIASFNLLRDVTVK